MDASLEFKGETLRERAEAFRKFRDVLPQRLEEAIEEIVIRIQADAARTVRVDTGRLRASIESFVERIADDVIRGEVGSNTEYAGIIEVKYPYLRPAIDRNISYIVDRTEKAVETAWGEALP